MSAFVTEGLETPHRQLDSSIAHHWNSLTNTAPVNPALLVRRVPSLPTNCRANSASKLAGAEAA